MGAQDREILEQMDVLHTEATKIAETMADIHVTEKDVNRKATAIGKAMLKQEKVAQQILENQEQAKVLLDHCRERADDKREIIALAVRDVAQSVANLQNAETKKNVLLQSLELLAEEQTTFIEENRAFAKRSGEDLELVKETVQQMRTMIENMTVEDQVAFMNAKMKEAQETLISYVEMRSEVIERMNHQMEETGNQIREIAKEMEDQTRAVDEVVTISRAYEEKTNQMCNILEKLLSEMKTNADTEEDLSLEELFGEASEEEQTEPEDNDRAEEPDFSEEPDDDEEEFESVPSEDDSDIQFINLDEEEPAPKRKKGFFGKLFGGGKR